MSWKTCNTLLIKEHVGMFKAANNYDIFDATTGEQLMQCREPNLGFLTKMFRFSDYKRMTPFQIEITTMDGQKVVEVSRGISLFLSKVKVTDENNAVIGGFKQKFLSIGGAFNVLDADENPICTLKGKWTSWDFKFEYEGKEFARVTKKWAGLGKELFTSADNYVLEINESIGAESPMRKLILSAVMCIDMVLKE